MRKKKKKTKKTQKKKNETTETKGFLIFSFFVISFISLASFAYGKASPNILGKIGNGIGWYFTALFGLGAYFACIFGGWVGLRIFFKKKIEHPYRIGTYFAMFVISICMLVTIIETHYPRLALTLGNFFYPDLWGRKLHYHLGGAPFYYIYRDLPYYSISKLFNVVGSVILFTSTLISSVMLLAKISPMVILESILNIFEWLKTIIPDRKRFEKENPFRFVKLSIPSKEVADTNSDLLAIKPDKELFARPSISRKEAREQPIIEVALPKPPAPKKKREEALRAQKVYNGDFKDYKIPPISLLTTPKKVDQSSLKKDLRRQAEVLEETLSSFGIEARVGQINCGPTITSFEVHPAIGVKVQKIKTLENDIALNMEAKSIRIIAPIPGKAAVGIEVPNPQPQEVALKDMLEAYQQGKKKFHIPILLGKTVNGEYVMNDLCKMPHCIIAGATGSGKSVCINTLIMSILHTAKPDEIKLLMVDPKKVELTPYSKLPHMLAPVITEPQGACAALNWLVKEMENRYDILKIIGYRNIEAFNNRPIDEKFEESLDREIPKKMHYIVGIIDELADLMMVASNDIETPIARIAQMARAVGIHLILATQRPSREVITGLIKANFPTRISFKVASRINSQIILDEIGAESLLGNGDMLFLPPGTHHLHRAQGAYVRDEDINKVVKYICDQAPPNYLIDSFDQYSGLSSSDFNPSGEGPSDTLYDKALDIVTSTGNASTTFLQRKLKIGYARAASLMDELETQGIVTPPDGSRPRKVLAARGNTEEQPDLFD